MHQVSMPDIFNGNQNMISQMEDTIARLEQAKKDKQSKAKKSKAKKAKKKDEEDVRDADTSDSGSDSEEKKSSDDDDSSSSSSSSEDDEEEKPSAAASKKSKIVDDQRNADGSKKEKRPRLLFVHEAEEHMRRLFKKEELLMKYLWASMSPQPSQDYRMFFIRCLAVAPPRFRPSSAVGDRVSVHPQNFYLKKILEASDSIVALKAAVTDNVDESGDEKMQVEESDEDNGAVQRYSRPKVFVAGIDMGALVTSWIELQENVNCLLDSGKTSQAKTVMIPSGIRQILEKKEGLFRKHMMGKRVNFAARSVISPDPYIHTNEIGVPERFAKKLTYPEPVNAHNVSLMRQLVVNGPNVYPGANYIQDERGYMIDLSKRSEEQRVALSKTLLTSQGSIDGTDGGMESTHPVVGVKKVLRHLRSGDVVIMNRQPTLHKPSMMCHKARILRGQQTIRMHYANCNTFNADFDGDEMNMHFPQNELARAEAYNIANTDNQYVKPTDGTPLRGLIQDHVGSGVLLTQRDTFFTRAEYQQVVWSSCIHSDGSVRIEMEPPAILKPVPRWTGKQVVTTVLNHLTRKSKSKLTLVSKAKVPGSAWGAYPEESEIIFRNNELLQGVLDKSQFGASKFGLVHGCYELFGAAIAGDVLSSLGRLFTFFLQSHGFTCGIDDMLLVESAENDRRKIIEKATKKGIAAHSEFVGVKKAKGDEDPSIVMEKLQKVIREDEDGGAKLDGAIKGVMNEMTSKIINACIPVGQVKPFPYNCMSLMTLSGAKGSLVNFSQISCLLGQQELEGRRVPMMASGRTLPSFRKYDTRPRAGGYVSQRFLTGIRPQEYYFHCMAGREGLVDTAVKTSRSGYLQRCLVKHLEGLVVQYDHTVRDADGSVIQFHYGEDSIDVAKSAYLEKFKFHAQNYEGVIRRLDPGSVVGKIDTVEDYLDENDLEDKPDLDPVLSLVHPGAYIGAVSDSFSDKLESFISSNPDNVLTSNKNISPDKFRLLMQLNYMKSIVPPGESVGCLAAQSVGEPSTQMTLNTFHLAGHGGANVTLGIPRLREIIMTASENIGTPLMELPILNAAKEVADRLAGRLSQVRMADFISSLSVQETISTSGTRVRLYRISLGFLPMFSQKVKEKDLKFSDFQRALESQIVPLLLQRVAKELKRDRVSTKMTGAQDIVLKVKEARQKKTKLAGDDDDAESTNARKKKHSMTSYEEPDEDDKEVIRQAKKKTKSAVDSDDESEENDSDSDSSSSDSPSSKKKSKKEKTGLPMSKSELAEAQQAKDAMEVEAEADAQDSDEARLFRLVSRNPHLRDVKYNADESGAEIVVQVPLEMKKLLMLTMAEEVVTEGILRSVENIGDCFVIERRSDDGNGKDVIVQTNGVNFHAAWENFDKVDVNRIMSNDIGAILRTYGVEAASAAIAREITNVFGVYGISVSPRHLRLLSDYMTFQGGYRALSRIGISSNPSPFQKVSFETSTNFILDACLSGELEDMSSPSARLVLGQPVKCGTGMFELRQPLQ